MALTNRNPSAGNATKAEEVVFQVAYAWTAIPAHFALEKRRWKEAASLTLPPAAFPWERFRFAEANLYFARAVGAARNGNAGNRQKARAYYTKLTSLCHYAAGQRPELQLEKAYLAKKEVDCSGMFSLLSAEKSG